MAFHNRYRFLSILFAMFFSIIGISCGSVQKWTSSDNMTNEERIQAFNDRERTRVAELERNRQSKNEAEEKKKSVMVIGTPYLSFVSAFGGPTATEMVRGTLYYHSSVDGQPMVFQFRKDKLIAWSIDRAAVEVSMPEESVDAPSAHRMAITGGSSGCGDGIESRINGNFEGWTGESIFQLTNGQIWKQSSYSYHYSYAYMPEILILPLDGCCRLFRKDDTENRICVTRIR